MCGVTGLKTTVGRVSRAGIYPLSQSLDSAGPLTRDAADAAIVYEAMQGPDPADPTTRGQSPHDVTSGIERGVAGLTLGVPRAVFWEDCDAEVEARTREAIAHLESLGARVIDIEFEQAESARRLNPRGLVIAGRGLRRQPPPRRLEVRRPRPHRRLPSRERPRRSRARVPGDGARMGRAAGADRGGARRHRRSALSDGDGSAGAGRRSPGEHRDPIPSATCKRCATLRSATSLAFAG